MKLCWLSPLLYRLAHPAFWACCALGICLAASPSRVSAQQPAASPAPEAANSSAQDAAISRQPATPPASASDAPVAAFPPAPSAPQSPAAQTPPPRTQISAEPTTIFAHPDATRWYLAGQANIVFQYHPAFPALYSGTNSFGPGAQDASTQIFTLFSGYEVTPTTEVLADVEEAVGGGVGRAVGLAGYVDLDAVRTVQGSVLAPVPYFARLLVHQIIPLGSKRVPAQRGPLGLFTSLPARRIEIRFGKFTLPDFLDTNRGGGDSHLQFLNWTVVNNGVWDYAANTRGYTDGLYLEYDDRWFSLRFAEALMPKTANGIYLDADLARANSSNLEAAFSGNFLAHRPGNLRLLAYENHADMGNYREAIQAYLDHLTPTPDIVATQQQGRTKYGFGVNFDQDITSDIGVFARWGWADGKNEAFAYTEDDRTAEAGMWIAGKRWRRDLDKIGVAYVNNGLSGDHLNYLRLGGLGFLLGDGALNYGHENIQEAYYTAHLWRGVWGAFDFQQIENPGYNRARGPASVLGLRLHVDF